MKNIDRKFKQASEEDLDRILDATLAKYASVEPRLGLEDRILVSLRSNATPTAQHAWWHWRFAAALAAVLVALVIGMRSTKPNSEGARHQTPVQPGSSEAEFHKLGPDDDIHERQPPIDISGASAITIRRKPRVPNNPKLDQFPSPHPLSEQEQMLALYVAQFNDEAVIVARVRSEGMRLDREKEIQEAEESGNQYPKAR